ncbi:YhcH/YjgK/YiaL family protein [Shewanella sp. 3B26]|uniref:YhcH/YjgK/YiaL family protein n=1 Tax=Shewanella zhuhaiensis TaxID=2919576 RepID=A0AAJ1BJA9_9GAMM|nr:YhcH/YjgK/YiaL family protein [Shewanella zhuhaiensis]MCH4295839.1 YhcH/YjgK/YiaL family protein [Shewanella zhuhaiensis]
MIVDKLENRHRYTSLHPRITAALEFLAGTDLTALPKGRHTIDGDNLFAIVNDYLTQPAGTEPFETHRRYADVQFVVSGEEAFGYLPLEQQQPLAAYNEAHDFIEYDYEQNREAASFIPLKANMFAIFMPEDMHMPGTGEQPVAVRKVVCKVLL